MCGNKTETYCAQDTLKLLEYSSQLGEAFRPLFGPKFTRLTYFVAGSFVTNDTVVKYPDIRDRHNGNADRVISAMSDIFLWRMMASIIFPGMVIRAVSSYTGYRLARYKVLPIFVQYLLTSCVGLAIVPAIVNPIDNVADVVLDNTLRKSHQRQ